MHLIEVYLKKKNPVKIAEKKYNFEYVNLHIERLDSFKKDKVLYFDFTVILSAEKNKLRPQVQSLFVTIKIDMYCLRC